MSRHYTPSTWRSFIRTRGCIGAPQRSRISWSTYRTSAPSVHGVLKTLQKRNLISRRAGEARSTKVLLAPHEIPELE